MDKTIRWKQRFDNFSKAYAQLNQAIQIQNPNDTERAGLIQFFEVAFELSWKTLKDFLEAPGNRSNKPSRRVISPGERNGWRPWKIEI